MNEELHNIGRRIWIVELQCFGRIIGIYIGIAGIQYLVRYFDNAEAKEVYFYPDELDPDKSE